MVQSGNEFHYAEDFKMNIAAVPLIFGLYSRWSQALKPDLRKTNRLLLPSRRLLIFGLPFWPGITRNRLDHCIEEP